MRERYPRQTQTPIRPKKKPSRHAGMRADYIGTLLLQYLPQARRPAKICEGILRLDVQADVPSAIIHDSLGQTPASRHDNILPAFRDKDAIDFDDATLDAALLHRGN